MLTSPHDHSSVFLLSCMAVLKPLFATMLGVPMAFVGLASPALAAANPAQQPLAVVSADQLPAQKAAVAQALTGVKVAHAALQAQMKVFLEDHRAFTEAKKAKDEALTATLKTKLDQHKTALKPLREAHQQAMQAFHRELLKLPQEERKTYRDELHTYLQANKPEGVPGHHGMKKGWVKRAVLNQKHEVRKEAREAFRQGVHEFRESMRGERGHR